MMKPLLLAIPVVLLLGGCAMGQKFDYAGADVRVDAGDSNRELALGALDRRTYVVDGSKQADFVGLARGGFGEPFDVTTASGAGLATDMVRAIGNALREAGHDIEVLDLASDLEWDKAREALTATGSERSLLLVLHEWKTDTMWRTGLDYDVSLTVFDESGERVAMERIAGSEEKFGGILEAEEFAREWFAEKMNELLGRDSLAEALTAAP